MREITKNWLEFVNRDIKVAEDLLPNEYYSNAVLFHCQQAVEKVLKAVLDEYKLDVPKIHSVIKLYDKLRPDARSTLDFPQNHLERIDEIYIGERYPGPDGYLPNGFPTKKEAKEIYKMASEIVNKTIRYLERKRD